MDVADVQEPHLALVHRSEGVRDEGIEPGPVDLHVEDSAASGRHGDRLHVVERIPGPMSPKG